MRFMIIVKSCEAFEAEGDKMEADPALMAEMGEFHEELAKAGVLLDGAGLKPSRKGWRIRYEPGAQGDQRTVVDGPFAEAKELVAGYTLIQVRSREEALEWSRRFPNPAGRGKSAVIEVREFWEMDDIGTPEQTKSFRELGLQ